MDGYDFAKFSVIFALELERVAVDMGFTAEQARILAGQTTTGSIALLKEETLRGLRCRKKPTL